MRAFAKHFYAAQAIAAVHLGALSDSWAAFAASRIAKIAGGETIAGDVAAWCLSLLVLVLWVAVAIS